MTPAPAIDAEESQQPYKKRRRIFVATHDQVDEDNAYCDEEVWQSFVDWFWQTHFPLLRPGGGGGRFDRLILPNW